MSWLPIVEFFGQLALKYGLAWLEQKHPGISPILDKIIKWISGQAAVGHVQAINSMVELDKHVDKLCTVGCPTDIKKG